MVIETASANVYLCLVAIGFVPLVRVVSHNTHVVAWSSWVGAILSGLIWKHFVPHRAVAWRSAIRAVFTAPQTVLMADFFSWWILPLLVAYGASYVFRLTIGPLETEKRRLAVGLKLTLGSLILLVASGLCGSPVAETDMHLSHGADLLARLFFYLFVIESSLLLSIVSRNLQAVAWASWGLGFVWTGGWLHFVGYQQVWEAGIQAFFLAPGDMPVTLFFGFWVMPVLIAYGASFVGTTAVRSIEHGVKRPGLTLRLALAGGVLVALGAVAVTMCTA